MKFAVRNGEALCDPVPANFGEQASPPLFGKLLQDIGGIMKHVRTESIRTYATKLEAGWVEVEL
ncbi:MAG: hypothetical protein WCK63_08900 [Betaproteobacteria bacterium]